MYQQLAAKWHHHEHYQTVTCMTVFRRASVASRDSVQVHPPTRTYHLHSASPMDWAGHCSRPISRVADRPSQACITRRNPVWRHAARALPDRRM